jgi:entericidin A
MAAVAQSCARRQLLAQRQCGDAQGDCAGFPTVEKLRELENRSKEGPSMKASLLVAALAGAALLLAGCATVKGVGKDISSVGQAGEDAIKGK